MMMMMMMMMVQFLHLYCAALTAQTVTSAQSNHARRLNGTATFLVCVGIVPVSGLRHEWRSEFQLVGPDTAKLRGPYVDVLVRGTARSLRAEERLPFNAAHFSTVWAQIEQVPEAKVPATQLRVRPLLSLWECRDSVLDRDWSIS